MGGAETPRERLARLLEAAAGQAPHTPAERLRALLTELEIRVANMKGVGAEVLSIPPLLDRAVDLVEQLRADGVDVQPEETRLENVLNQFRRKAPLFLREAGGARALAKLRAQHHPPRERWWWYVDELVAQERRQRLLRWAKMAAGILLLLVLAYFFIQSRLPKDPRVRRMVDLQMALDSAVAEQNWPEAVRILEELRTLDPTDPSYAVELGVLYEHLGEKEKAREAFDAARALTDEGTYYKLRAMAYLHVGDAKKALREAQQAVRLRPDDAEAYFYLGNAYELLSDVPHALEAYEKASELAQAQGQEQLYAVIRVRMAYLLQRPPVETKEP
ncbi:MAG: tetratricopeptide repeat protein [Chloroflexi bacterium]|nr:tetratricopeptide repeat protein [Chloroflexota bacterium]